MPSKRKPASSPVETEAKIRVASFAPLRRRIKALRGRLLHARTRETNTLFDRPDGSIRASGGSFRVRGYGSSGSITLKGSARLERGLKSRIELETEVASPEMTEQILVGLGFVAGLRYEKFREVWKIGTALLCLDETPLGRFVEIEGAKSAVHRTAASLGL